VLNGDAVREAGLGDSLFADLIAAHHAAHDSGAMRQLHALLNRVQPDVVHLEQPWSWLPLRQALKTHACLPIVYSSQNIEWRLRPEMFRLGLRRPGDDAFVAATRALEMELWRRADRILSISDIEANEIEMGSGRDDVAYLPAISDIAEVRISAAGRFGTEAVTAGIRYAALLSSAYWPNNEGFHDMFADGLGFLRDNEQIWVGGQLGAAIARDRRYQDYQTINDSRMRQMGYIATEEKAAFFGAADCVLVPVRMGAGSKLKTADALASGRAVITTSHGIAGYGPIVAQALGRGIYVSDDPADFRALVTRALREGLPGCDETIRAALSQHRLAETIGPLYARFRRSASIQEVLTL
jgi:Glycosyl transferase 4-like domain/Glycosyl transferases group 1